jgi:hypothetical protein
MASAGLRDDDGCIHATSRKALKTRRLQKQTSSMHAIPSRKSNGVELEALTKPLDKLGKLCGHLDFVRASYGRLAWVFG